MTASDRPSDTEEATTQERLNREAWYRTAPAGHPSSPAPYTDPNDHWQTTLRPEGERRKPQMMGDFGQKRFGDGSTNTALLRLILAELRKISLVLANPIVSVEAASEPK